MDCVICGTAFVPRRPTTDKTCSPECQVEHRRALSREKAKRHYKPRAPRPDSVCQGCGAVLPTPKTGPVPKWCGPCRANKEYDRAKDRQVGERRCHKCDVVVPEAFGRPGVAVCNDCRADKRNRSAHEARRRFRKYGITQDDYDEMFRVQGGRCAICATADPGRKGFAIDHDHDTGKVRAILCGACNSAFGLLRESAVIVQAMLDYAERHSRAT